MATIRTGSIDAHAHWAPEGYASYLAQLGHQAGTTQSPLVHQTWQMARVAELVMPTPETAVGAINPEAFAQSVATLTQVGLIKNPVTFEEVVDTSVYDAVHESMMGQ